MEELTFKESKLTPRQWAFYRLLKSDPNKWWTQKEICESIPLYNYKENPKATNDHCSTIGEDKRVINENQRVDKIIVMKDYCFKIGTLEEYKIERASHIARLKSQKAQIEAMDMKFERDGQVKVFNNVLDELKETNEQVHETFVDMPKEINGVKVYTRVLINWKESIAYIVTARKFYVEYDIRSASYYCNCLMANDHIAKISNIQERTYAYEDFLIQTTYKGFKREYIR